MGGVAVLPSLLLSLLLLVIAAAAAGAEDAMIRPAAAAAGNDNKVLVGTLCCSNMTGFDECVHDCLVILPPEDAVKYCDRGCKEAYQCQTVSGDECPSPSPSGHDHSSPDLMLAVTTESAAAVVGEAVAQVQAAAAETLCCSNTTGFHECVHDCFAILPPEDAVKFCDRGCKEAYQCQTDSGDECPSGHSSSSSDDDSSAKGNAAAVDRCILGCNSSVCNKMDTTGVGRKGVVKHALQRCNNACYEFCTKGVRAGTSTA